MDTYAAAFGKQWHAYRTTQLDSRSGLTLSRDRTRDAMGALYDDLRGKQVLECGCGAGRFTEILLQAGAEVTSIDLSSAVDANLANFPLSPSHRIAQADIRHLPFAPGRFDIVFCLGVVQHTPDPEQTIARLFDQVRPGGWLVIDHYGDRLRWYTRTAPIYRLRLKRRDDAQQAIERLVDRWLPLHKRAAGHTWARRLLVRVSPIVTYYERLPTLDDKAQREWALLDTHDSLTDWYKHFRSRRQIKRLLEALGAEDILVTNRNGMVEARARRPHTDRKDLGET